MARVVNSNTRHHASTKMLQPAVAEYNCFNSSGWFACGQAPQTQW